MTVHQALKQHVEEHVTPTADIEQVIQGMKEKFRLTTTQAVRAIQDNYPMPYVGIALHPYSGKWQVKIRMGPNTDMKQINSFQTLKQAALWRDAHILRTGLQRIKTNILCPVQ